MMEREPEGVATPRLRESLVMRCDYCPAPSQSTGM